MKTYVSSFLFSLGWFCHHLIHLFNGPGFLGVFVAKGPSFLKKYTYFTGFSALPSIEGHDIGKRNNNVFFRSPIPAGANINEMWEAVYLYVKEKVKFSIG